MKKLYPTGSSLRMAVFLNGYTGKKWQEKALRELVESTLVIPVLFIIKEEIPGPGGLFRKLWNYIREHFLYKLYTRFIWKIPALEAVSLEEFIKDVPVIRCKTIRKGKHSEYFSAEDLAVIRSYDLDFALRFGFNIIRGEILELPKYGVWSYHHGDERVFRGGPAGFWEIYHHHAVNGVILQKLNHLLDAGIVLERRIYKTVMHSYAEHFDKILSASTDMPLKTVRRILQGDVGFLTQPHSITTAPVTLLPTNWEMIVFTWKMWGNRLRFYQQKYARAENWMVGYTHMPIDDFMDRFPDIPRNWLRHQKGSYYADPFTADGYLWVEDYDYDEKKGKITRLSFHEQTLSEGIREFPEKPKHLAYPYTFRLHNELFMIPETACEGNIQLFRWNPENETMEFHAVLLDIPGVDASLYYDGKYYWIFTGIQQQFPNEKLFVYYAETLSGPYHPHVLNPVVTDPSGARMAGNFIPYKDKILRPAQYSKSHYGEKITLFEITKLTPFHYEETAFRELAPHPHWAFSDGMHTLSYDQGTVVWDVKKMKSGWKSFWAHFKK